jgi:hypothetical protein
MNIFVRCGVVCLVSVGVMLSSIGQVKETHQIQSSDLNPTASGPSVSLVGGQIEPSN